MKRLVLLAALVIAATFTSVATATAITTTGEDGHTALVGVCHENPVSKVFYSVWVERDLVGSWLETFPVDFIIEPDHDKVCPPVVTPPPPPPPVTKPAVKTAPPNTDAVALCGMYPGDTIVRMWGIPTKQWLTGTWLPQGSGGLVIDVSKWQMADYGPSGLFCRDAFNAAGLTESKTKVDGTGKANFSTPNEGNIYELWVKSS